MTHDARIDPEKYEGQQLFVYVPLKDRGCLIVIEEGSGDNLLTEDISAGYVDYVNYSIGKLSLSACDIEEPDLNFRFEDGGMVMFKTYVQGMTVGEIVRAVMEDAGLGSFFFGMLLKGGVS